MSDTPRTPGTATPVIDQDGILWIGDGIGYVPLDANYKAALRSLAILQREHEKSLTDQLTTANKRIAELEETIERLQDSRRRRVQKESDAAWDRGEEMTDTPRTDAEEQAGHSVFASYMVVTAAFSRELERELAAAAKRIAELERERNYLVNVCYKAREDCIEDNDCCAWLLLNQTCECYPATGKTK